MNLTRLTLIKVFVRFFDIVLAKTINKAVDADFSIYGFVLLYRSMFNQY